MTQSRVLLWLIMIAGVCLLPYTQGGLVWDDHILLSEGLWKNDSIASIWLQSVQGGEIASQYYRPIPMTIFALVQSVKWLHVIALFVHLGSAWLLSEWLNEHIQHSNVIYVGTVLFLLHPIQTEVLAWASCLPDILAVHLGLWTVWCANHKRSSIVIGTSLFCGMLSKEIALLPILVWGMNDLWLTYRSEKPWRTPKWLPTVMVTLLLVVGVRWTLQVHTVLPTSFETVSRTTLVTIGMGWFSWLVPFPHFPVRDVWVLPMWSVYMGWAWSILCLVTIRNRMGWLIAMGGLFLSLPPVWVGYFAAERYLYISSIGFVWLTCAILDSSRLNPKFLQTLIVIWMVSTGIIHWNRAEIWSSDRALFAQAVKALPTSGYTWHLQGMSQIQRGEFTEAFESFKAASRQVHSHYQSGEFAIRSALEANMTEEAFQFAEGGPKDGLSRGYLEAWLQAAQAVGDESRIDELRRTLGL